MQIITGDCREQLKTLPAGSVHVCVTSPPYFALRDYGHDGQIGLEATPEAFVAEMVEVFREVRRVLRDDGTLWLNLGDTYAGAGRHCPRHQRIHGLGPCRLGGNRAGPRPGEGSGASDVMLVEIDK